MLIEKFKKEGLALTKDAMKQVIGGYGPWGYSYTCNYGGGGFSTIGWWVNHELAKSTCGFGGYTYDPIF